MSKLLDHHADPKQRHQHTQNTALHIACDNGDLEAVKILAGKSDLDALNKEKETPMEVIRR